MEKRCGRVNHPKPDLDRERVKIFMFMSDRLVPGKMDQYVFIDDLFRNYKVWLDRMSYPPTVLNKTGFGRMIDKGFERRFINRTSGRGRAVMGVQFA